MSARLKPRQCLVGTCTSLCQETRSVVFAKWNDWAVPFLSSQLGTGRTGCSPSFVTGNKSLTFLCPSLYLKHDFASDALQCLAHSKLVVGWGARSISVYQVSSILFHLLSQLPVEECSSIKERNLHYYFFISLECDKNYKSCQMCMCMKNCLWFREFTTTTEPVKNPCHRMQPRNQFHKIIRPRSLNHSLQPCVLLLHSLSHACFLVLWFFQELRDIHFEVPVYQDGWKQSGSLGVWNISMVATKKVSSVSSLVKIPFIVHGL